jgi:DNA-binding CsgD family transcriptional regulator
MSVLPSSATTVGKTGLRVEMTNEIMAMVRKCMKTIEQELNKGPVLFFDKKGNYWQNQIARQFMTERKIPVDDFMEWLMVGSSHLQNLSYGNVRVKMMGLPGKSVIVFLKDRQSAPGKKNDNGLTSKEKEILSYLIKGFSNKKIGTFLNISAGTVNNHLDHIYDKLRCSSRQAAAFTALKHGLYLPSAERVCKAAPAKSKKTEIGPPGRLSPRRRYGRR